MNVYHSRKNLSRFNGNRRRLTAVFLFVGALLAVLIPAALITPKASAATVSISSPANVTMSAIPGTGGISTGSATWTVNWNSLLGYSLTVQASGAPAMTQGGLNIPDYPATTPQTWSVAATDAAFGFSAQGSNTPTGTWGTPASGAGKYRGFAGTTPIQIASTALLGGNVATTVYFQAEVGSSLFQPSGTYVATITATATVTL